MDLACSGVADHADKFAAGGSAHQRIVHENHSLAGKQMAHRVELQLHAEVADRLRRLNERPPDIVIANQAMPERNTRFGRVPQSRGNTRVRYWNDDIGIDRILTGQQPSHHFARFLHRTAKHRGIGTREIHVLEDALRSGLPSARSAPRTTPSGPTITISPGSTSFMYTASIRSKAHVSEAKTYA